MAVFQNIVQTLLSNSKDTERYARVDLVRYLPELKVSFNGVLTRKVLAKTAQSGRYPRIGKFGGVKLVNDCSPSRPTSWASRCRLLQAPTM